MDDWRLRNRDYVLAKQALYREKHKEELKAKARSYNRLLKGVITLDDHDKTLKLWNESHEIEDEEERESFVEMLRERERMMFGEAKTREGVKSVEVNTTAIEAWRAERERRKTEREAKHLRDAEEKKRLADEAKAERIAKETAESAKRLAEAEEAKRAIEEEVERLRAEKRERVRVREEEETRKREAEEAWKRERREHKRERLRRVAEAKAKEAVDAGLKKNHYTPEEREEALAWFKTTTPTTGRGRKPEELLNDHNVWYRIVKYRLWKAKQLADATAWLESVD